MGTNGSTMLEPLRQGLPPTDPSGVAGSASCALPARYEAVGGARKFTRSTLERWELGDRFDDVALVVSELVTNALRHGGGRYTLRLSAGPDKVTAAVSDPSPAHPRECTPDLNGGSGGFGWHMVRRLTSSLTITAGPSPGKTIHAHLTRCDA